MNHERRLRVEGLFQEAIDLRPRERFAFLREQCGSDTDLRADVEKLLAVPSRAADDLLDPGVMDDTGASSGDLHPDFVGSYRILREIGRGGMGVVYLAEQQKPLRRNVAVKLIKLGMESKDVIARFEAERQALAVLDHPNVARVFDAGTNDEGRPFFVLEYVDGLPINIFCERYALGLHERIELFLSICDAVQHAHQNGIIHRDLKPTNILVAMDANGRPVPKVIDFGIAKAINTKLSDATLMTAHGVLLGTPEYMSPEQAASGARDAHIDTRADTYSLGVVLYELLVGVLPFEFDSTPSLGLDDILRMVKEEEATKPSDRLSKLEKQGDRLLFGRQANSKQLKRALQGDLDWITMKALDKDPQRRYSSVSEFAADLRRHLTNQPVHAGPPNRAYIVKKFVRRNRVGVFAGALVAVTLLAATGVSIGFALREAAQREQLKAVVEFQSSMLGGIDAETMGRNIIEHISASLHQELVKAGESDENVDGLLALFGKLNATDVALRIVDKEVLARAAGTIEERFRDQPMVEATLRYSVAETYRELGLYPQALGQLERALTIRRREFGNDHPDTLNSMNGMGFLLEMMGRYEEALPYFEETLESRRRTLGNEHRQTLLSIANTGSLLTSMGRFEEALPFHREALESRRRILGDKHPDTLQSVNSTGTLLQSMGRYEEALPFCREAKDGLRRVLGEEDPVTLQSVSNTGVLLKSMGRYEEALPLYRAVLESRRRVLGNEHQQTLQSLSNTGVLLKTMGRYEEALPYYREALDGCRRVLGNDHPGTLTSINNTATLLKSMGRYEEALPFQLEALESCRRVLGNDHPNSLKSARNTGTLLHSMGRYEEALPYSRAATEGSRRVLGDEHPNTLGSIHNLSEVLQDLGQLEEAEVLGVEAVHGARQSLPAGHWHTGVYLSGFGKTLSHQRRFAEASAALLEAHRILEGHFGAEHDRTVKIIQCLIDHYTAWHVAEPGAGHDADAAKWRVKLDA